MKTVLFVCTGNTCRSPMAACLFNALCQQNGWTELRAVSAGLRAMSGAPASDGAREAMARRGLSLREHRSQPVDRRLLCDVSLVVGMSGGHVDTLRRLFPSVNVPMRAFEPPIADPYAMDLSAYERAAQEMEAQLEPLAQTLVREK